MPPSVSTKVGEEEEEKNTQFPGVKGEERKKKSVSDIPRHTTTEKIVPRPSRIVLLRKKGRRGEGGRGSTIFPSPP